jgi:phage terminase large subunit GpA-like protein
MMDAITDPKVETVTLMTAARVGKTEVINNILGRYIDNEPCPILSVNPTVEMAEAWSKKYFAPMIRDTPVLRDKVREAKTRDTNNTILEKSFPGGYIAMAGANSPAGLASRTIMIVVLDEVDRFPPSAGTEGDPVDLAKKRAETFTYRKKFVQTSTPTIKGVSRIEQEWNQSDQRRYYVPCPRCNYFQHLQWKQIKFEKDHLENVFYECEKCQGKINEADKPRLIRLGEWRAGQPLVIKHVGFHLNALYSPWISWEEVVRKFLNAKKRPETLKVWVNTMLGETWEEEESFTLSDETLAGRIEQYEKIPKGVVLLTAGVDVQDDRVVCLVKGWGLHDESWFIDYKTFYGSPGREDTWNLLDAYLTTSIEHENGVTLRIMSVCIDSGGHFTSNVYDFTKRRRSRRVYAIKGYGGYGRPFIGKASKNNKKQALVFPLGVDTAKELIYDRLQITDPGSGYMHFNQECNEEYFLQLTSEKHVTRYTKGFPTKVWELKSGRRNEALDCEVYALAAYTLLNASIAILSKKLEERAKAHHENPLVPYQAPAKKRVTMRIKGIGGGFTHRYRP